MLHKPAARRSDRGFRRTLAKAAIATILTAVCVNVGNAQPEQREQRKKRFESLRLVIVEYKGPDTAEVVVTDSRQNQREILRKVMRKGEEARTRAMAIVTRETQDAPEIKIRWKVTGPYDEKGVPPRADSGRKIGTWCGDIDGSDRRTKLEVGFQSDGVGGRSC